MSDWQKIETAPKDGSELLLCETDGDGTEIYDVAFWNVFGVWEPVSGGTSNEGWTHWQPLPEPPKEQT